MDQETERGYEDQIVELTSLLKECIQKNALEIKLQMQGMTIDQAMLMIIKAVSEENQTIYEAVKQLESKIGRKFLQNLELAIEKSEFFKKVDQGSFQKKIEQFFKSEGVTDDLNLTDFENLNNINFLSLMEKYESVFTQSAFDKLRQIVQQQCSQKIDLSVKNNSQPIEKEQYQEKPPQQIDYSNTYPSEDTSKKQITLKETLQEDLKKYPECAEKTLVELQVLGLAAIVSPTELNGDSQINQLDLIINKFSTQLCETNEFSQDREKWRKQLCYFAKQKEWKDFLETIRGIFKIIRPINIFELLRLVEKANEAGKVIKGQNVILFLGATGSGKSTAIHFLAGTPQIQQDDNIFPDMSRIKYKELEQIIVGKEDTSVTRYITPITINLKDIGMLQNEMLVLCDAPGFFDTQGAEVDIANGIGIVSSMKQCNTLKPVIVFSKLGIGDRGDTFKAMIRMLSSLFDGVGDKISPFCYIFNKYNKGDTIEKIGKKIESIFTAEKETNGELNRTSNEFFEDIITKCYSKQDVIKLDPLNDKPNKCVKQLKEGFITNPSEVLKYTISSDSKAQIQSLLGIIQQRFDKYLENRKIDLIMFDISQLSNLKQILQNQEITQAYERYIEKLNQRLKNEQIGLLNEFNCFINSQALFDTLLLEKYGNNIQYYKKAYAILREHLNNNYNCNGNSFVEELESNLTDKMRYISEKKLDFLQDSQAAMFRKIDLENLKLVAKLFPENNSYYIRLKSRIQEALETLISLIQDKIDQLEFQTCGTIFGAMQNAINVLQYHYPDKELYVYLTNCSKLFKEFIDTTIKAIQGYFQNSQIAIKKIEQEYVKLQNLAEVHELEGCYKSEAKKSFLDEVNSIFRDYLIRMKEKIFKSENAQALNQVKLVLGDIKKISLLGNQATNLVYCVFINEIQSFIRQTSYKFDECLSYIEKDPKQFQQQCRKTQVILFIKDVKIIEDILGVSYTGQINQFEEGIIQFISELEESQIKLFLQQSRLYDKQNEIIDFLTKVNCLNKFKEILPQFQIKMLDFEKKLQTSFQNTFEEIKLKYKLGTFRKEDDVSQILNIAQIETILGFFKSCEHLNIIQQMAKDIYEQFSIHLQTIFDRIQKDSLLILKNIKCNPELLNSQLIQQYVHLIVEIKKTNYLNEITEGDSKINQLELELDSIHQHWKQKEQQGCTIQEYNVILGAAQVLSNLSIFSSKDNKFNSLELLFKSLRNHDMDELENQYIGYAKRKSYSLLKDVYRSKQHKTVITYINKNIPDDVEKMLSECEEAIKEARKSDSLSEPKSFGELPNNLSHIINAVDSFDTNPNSSIWKTRLDAVLASLDNHYKTQIKNMNRSLTTGKFEELVKQRKLLQEFDSHFKPFVKRLNCKDDLLKQNEYLLSMIQEWKKQLKQFEKRTNLIKYPIRKLEKLVDEIPELKEEFDQLIEVVENSLNSELETVEVQQDPEKKLDLINSRITILPEGLEGQYSVIITQKKNYFSSKEFQDFSIIKQDQIEKQSNKFIELFKKCQHKDFRTIRTDILNKLRCFTETTSEEIINYLNKNQLRQAISSLNSLQVMEKEWRTTCPEITNRFQITLFTTLSQFNKLIIYLSKPNQTEEYLSKLSGFIDVLVDIEKNISLIHPLMQYIQDLFNSFISYFGSLKDRFMEAIQSLQIQEMLEALNIIECQNNCLETILKMQDSKNPVRKPLQTIHIKSLTQKAAYLIIEDSFKTLIKDIANITLVKNMKKDRDHMYKLFLQRTKFAKDIIKSLNQFEKFNSGYQESIDELNSKLYTAIQECVGIIMQKQTLQRQLDKLKFQYENLISIQQYFLFENRYFSNNFLEIDKALSSRCAILLEIGNMPGQISQFVVELIDLKRIQNTIAEFSNQIFEKIEESLTIFMKISTNKKSAKNELICCLQGDDTGTWHYVISEHKLFKGDSTELFNELAKRHGIKYVCQNMQSQADKNSIDIEKLKEYHDKIKDLHLKIVQQNITKISNPKIANETISQIVFDSQKLWKGRKVTLGMENKQIKWDNAIRSIIPGLIAHLFAVWTLLNATNDFIEGIDDKFEKLLSPHAGQVVSILRLLGLGYKSSLTFDGKGLVNNLVQIGTGEGKSVALAIVATIFALLGAKVSCACHSKYLSTRDFESFKSFFEAFRVIDKIQYGTFDELCENMINTPVSIRQQVQDFIFEKKKINSSCTEISEPKILLIDEVDMFFSPSFYGQIYQPATRIKHPSINKLVHYLWYYRENNQVLKQIETSTEFKECCEAFKGWESVLKQVARAMIVDLKSYNHDYKVRDDQIVYPSEFGNSFSMVYGYKTMFSYFHEYESNRISKPRVEDNIYISLNCGRFSYAQIPQEFHAILGVTGTLNSLIEHQFKILQTEYKIQHFTQIPSVFGENQLKDFSKDIQVENKQDYHLKIKQQIEQYMNCADKKRAVLVFFESEKQLEEFNGSSFNKTPYNIMTEQTIGSMLTITEKQVMIKQATMSGCVTLLTRSLGRGTDFICTDKSLVNNGGIHVIQTFFSEDRSEEIQIKGRAARQGQKGSFSIVLLDSDLEKCIGCDYLKLIQQYREKDELYAKLDESRNNLILNAAVETQKSIENCNVDHSLANQFRSHLNTGNLYQIKTSLSSFNTVPEWNFESVSKTLILIDATSSMGSIINAVKNRINEMIKRTWEVLESNKEIQNSFMMQIAVYRDYDSKDEVLQESSWESTAKNLYDFLNTITAKGGDDYPEAIEIGLQFANSQTSEEISQIILIGDAPAKSKESITEYRSKKYGGEEYWSKTKFHKQTHYLDEIKALADKNIPIHAFYLHEGAAKNFNEMAKATNGTCQKLQLDFNKESDQLTNLVIEKLLLNIGNQKGKRKGDEMVEKYKKMYAKSYLS